MICTKYWVGGWGLNYIGLIIFHLIQGKLKANAVIQYFISSILDFLVKEVMKAIMENYYQGWDGGGVGSKISW